MTDHSKKIVKLIHQRRRDWAMSIARKYLRIGELPMSLGAWLTEDDLEELESEMWAPPEYKP